MIKRLIPLMLVLFAIVFILSCNQFITGKTISGSEYNQSTYNESQKCSPSEVEIAERNLITLSRINNETFDNVNQQTLLNSFCNSCLNLCNRELPPQLRHGLSRFLLRELRNSLVDLRTSERVLDNTGGIAGFNNNDVQLSIHPSIRSVEDLSKEHDLSVSKGCLRASFSGSMNLLEGIAKPKAEINIFEFINLQSDIKLDFKNKKVNEWECSVNVQFNW